MLIFVNTKKSEDIFQDRFGRALRQTVLAIHGDKLQSSRDYVLDHFRKDSRAILVATDVAARGLDIKDLDVVVNYDMPLNIEDYVHRIGLLNWFPSSLLPFSRSSIAPLPFFFSLTSSFWFARACIASATSFIQPFHHALFLRVAFS